MDHFIDEAGQLIETQIAFCEYGGFCRDHAWLFHRRAALSLTGVPVARMYEALLRQDISRLSQLERALEEPQGRRAARTLLDRRGCPACEGALERLALKTRGLVTALRDEDVRRSYRDSDGLCVEHLDEVGSDALGSDSSVAAFLIGEHRRRLEQLERRLVAYDRTRDYRFAGERTEVDANAWTDVVRSYVGEQFRGGDDE